MAEPTLLHFLRAHVLEHLSRFLLAERQQQDRGALDATAAFVLLLVDHAPARLCYSSWPTQVRTTWRHALRILAHQRARLRQLLFVGERLSARPPSARVAPSAAPDAGSGAGRHQRRGRGSAGRASAAEHREHEHQHHDEPRDDLRDVEHPRLFPDRHRFELALRRRGVSRNGEFTTFTLSPRCSSKPTASFTSVVTCSSCCGVSGVVVTLPSFPAVRRLSMSTATVSRCSRPAGVLVYAMVRSIS